MLALDLEGDALPGPHLPEQGKGVSHVGGLVEEDHPQVGVGGHTPHHQVSGSRPQEVPLPSRVHPVGVLKEQHVPGRTHPGQPERGCAEVPGEGTGPSEVWVGENHLSLGKLV